MFDIGFAELLLVSVVGLLVLGPERLPGAIRTLSLWLGKLRRSFNSVRAEIERELRADEIKQDLHNNAVMESLKQAEKDLRNGLDAPYDIGSIGAEPKEDKEADPPKT
jgi:sec-independent protein translocase protein TatB